MELTRRTVWCPSIFESPIIVLRSSDRQKLQNFTLYMHRYDGMFCIVCIPASYVTGFLFNIIPLSSSDDSYSVKLSSVGEVSSVVSRLNLPFIIRNQVTNPNSSYNDIILKYSQYHFKHNQFLKRDIFILDP